MIGTGLELRIAIPLMASKTRSQKLPHQLFLESLQLEPFGTYEFSSLCQFAFWGHAKCGRHMPRLPTDAHRYNVHSMCLEADFQSVRVFLSRAVHQMRGGPEGSH